jgi:uncharacterized membrane protein YkvA (DUF1232 family)
MQPEPEPRTEPAAEAPSSTAPDLGDARWELHRPAPPQTAGYYERLRTQISRWAERKGQSAHAVTEALLTLPDLFCLLCGLALDRAIPPPHKAKDTLAILYIMSPLDFLTEVLFGPLAYLDDVTVAVYILQKMIGHVPEEVLLRHWKGRGDAVHTIRHFVAVADELVGSGLLRRIRAFLDA